jgi:hypothetical protein
VQLDTIVDPQRIFTDYPYFSSYSDTLLASTSQFVERISARLGLKPGDRVIEIASNDGYLLRGFVERGIDVLGIEPAANVARIATGKGIPTLVRFFGSDVARLLTGNGTRPRLVVANNVVAHVPDINDFLAGVKLLLGPGSLATLEFHHLQSLIEQCQFDTIYHEHCQYLSLYTVRMALATHGLAVTDVERIPAQGGSLRVYVQRQEDTPGAASPAVEGVLAAEEAAGLRDLASYERFSEDVAAIRSALVSFLERAKQAGEAVVCYGAAAKGNTLLNSCGIGTGLVQYAVDRSPHKQGLFLPGSHIPIHAPGRVMETRPAYLLILPWNLKNEIMEQMSPIRNWGGRFVVAVPRLQVLP